VARRGTTVTFLTSEAGVLVADRTGDVYMFSLTDLTADAQLVLGHLSIVLDVVSRHCT